MITVTRAAGLVGLVLGGVLAAGCGSSTPQTPTGGSALPTLPPTPASVPGDYTTLAALEKQLDGVATCTGNGPQSAVCSLVVTTTDEQQISAIRPFEVKVFRSAAAASQYVALIHETNATRASTGTAERTVLAGPSWVVVPQTTTADLVAQLKAYLGGTVSS